VCNGSCKYEGEIDQMQVGTTEKIWLGSILLYFFFERVLTSCPWDVVPKTGFKDPEMKKSTYMFSRLGGGGTQFQFDANFFRWWD
jgi:hypothetical protein